MTDMVKYLSSEFLKHSNFWVLQVTCDQLYKIIEQDINFILYVGDYNNLGPEMPMEFFTQAQIVHKHLFSRTRYLFITLDFALEPKCIGRFGLPDKN